MNITEPVDAYYGVFNLPAFSPDNTTESLSNALTTVLGEVLDEYPAGEFFKLTLPPVEYTSFWGWCKDNNGPLNAGGDVVLGSKLLREKELMTDTTTLAKALKDASWYGSISSRTWW